MKILIEERNENGNVTHKKWSDGNEYWYDYDENGNVTHLKNSNGDEHWYDANGNEIHQRPADIQEIFNRLATFKNGYLNHYYTQIAGGGNVLMADIKRLEEYVAGLEAQL